MTIESGQFTPDRKWALALLREHVHSESLLRHGYTVEAVMAHFARLLGEDEEKWSLIGLLHDVDFEQYPDRHCAMTRPILAPLGVPEEWIRAIESHGYGLVSDVEPRHRMEKVLYATDELTGLISATALMRPSRSILDLESSSVHKKFKQKSFATGVDRAVIERGAAMLGMGLDELITQTILGMRAAADEIGLRGEL